MSARYSLPAYTAKDFMRLTQATESQYTYWVKQQVVRGDIGPAAGPGSRSVYSCFGLLQGRLAVHMNSLGMSAPKMRFLMSWLRMLESEVRSAGPRKGKLALEVRQAAIRIGRQVKADRVRVAQITAEEIERHNRAIETWRHVRRPDAPDRDRYAFVGFWYSIDPKQGDLLSPELIATDSIHFERGRSGAGVLLNILDALREIEIATGDTLPPA